MAYVTNGTTTVYFDVVEKEQFAGDADVTTNPVESGESIADHVEPKPFTHQINGVLVDPGSEAKFGSMWSMYKHRQIVKFVGRLGIQSVVITHLGRDYEGDIANGMSFDMTYTEVQITTTQTTTLSTTKFTAVVAKLEAAAKAKETTNSGTQSTKSSKS